MIVAALTEYMRCLYAPMCGSLPEQVVPQHQASYTRYLILKFALSAVMIVVISEVAKLSDRIGAVVASLPLITILSLIWLHLENQPPQKIANHAYFTFWYVLPTLPMFYLFPNLLERFGFWGALLMSIVLTAVSFVATVGAGRLFGVHLL
jgi:hypothetical protein